jgi:hypothetical protein
MAAFCVGPLTLMVTGWNNICPGYLAVFAVHVYRCPLLDHAEVQDVENDKLIKHVG